MENDSGVLVNLKQVEKAQERIKILKHTSLGARHLMLSVGAQRRKKKKGIEADGQ